jgi:PEP-CTERM motif
MPNRLFVLASFFALAIGFIPSSRADIITAWDFSTLTGGTGNYGPSPFTASTSSSNVTVGGLTRGSGVGTGGTASASAWGGNNMQAATAALAATGNDFFSFSVTADAGQTMSFTDIAAYNIRRSSSGPTTGLWQYQVGGGGFNDIGSNITWGANTTAAGNAQSAISLSTIGALQNVGSGITVDFRLLMFGGTSSSGTGYLNDPSTTNSNDFIVNGTFSAVPEPTSIALVGVVGALAGVTRLRTKRTNSK